MAPTFRTVLQSTRYDALLSRLAAAEVAAVHAEVAMDLVPENQKEMAATTAEAANALVQQIQDKMDELKQEIKNG